MHVVGCIPNFSSEPPFAFGWCGARSIRFDFWLHFHFSFYTNAPYFLPSPHF